MLKKTPPIPNKSNTVTRRLSVYLRTLDFLEKTGVEFTSSTELGEIEGVSPSLVRKDLSLFGSFGIKGQGYNVTLLKKQVTKILGFNRAWKIALIGAVGFSRTLAHSETFTKRNLKIINIFDNSVELIGSLLDGIPVHDIAQLETELDPRIIDMAIIAVPPPEVQRIIDRLGKIGVRGALYFASRSVIVPEGMFVLNKDITVELGVLTYHLSRKRKNRGLPSGRRGQERAESGEGRTTSPADGRDTLQPAQPNHGEVDQECAG